MGDQLGMFFCAPSGAAVNVGKRDHLRELHWHGLKKVTLMDDRHRYTCRMDRVPEYFADVLLLSKLDIKAVVNMELPMRTLLFDQATDQSRAAPAVTAQFHEFARYIRGQDPVDKVMDVGRLLYAHHVKAVITSRDQHKRETRSA